MPTNAPGLLKKAADHLEERGKQYDEPGGERSMGKTVAAFNAITGRMLREDEGWLLLQILKDVRLYQNPKAPHRDSIEDGVAYAALKGEAWLREAPSKPGRPPAPDEGPDDHPRETDRL